MATASGLNKKRQEGKQEEDKERKKELKESFLGSWESIMENNSIIVSTNDANQVRVLLNAMKDIKRLEKIADIVGELADMVRIYSDSRMDIKDGREAKLLAKQIVVKSISQLNELFNVNIQFQE